jgi:hypothetical protein
LRQESSRAREENIIRRGMFPSSPCFFKPGFPESGGFMSSHSKKGGLA